MAKRCACAKTMLKNQPCWLSDPRCGQICAAKLRCGVHTCRKTCHRPGECEDTNGQKCTQTCGRPKKLCGHPCEEPCHAPYPCTQERPCAARRLITCPCQHRKQEVRCGASAANNGRTSSDDELACDDECARVARNRALAAALEVDPEQRNDEHVPYATETLSLFAAHGAPAAARDIESTMRTFAADASQIRHRFKPMRAPERALVHALANDFQLDAESIDPEPHRHVALFKTPRFPGAPPAKTLRDAARVRALQAQRAGAEERSRAMHDSAAETSAGAKGTHPPAPYNALVLTDPHFGLVADDLLTALRGANPPVSIQLTPDFESASPCVLLIPSASSSTTSTDPDSTSEAEIALQTTLQSLLPTLSRTLRRANCGSGLMQARVSLDESGKTALLFRETDFAARANASSSAAAGGWSQVAAKAAAPRAVPTRAGVGARSAFTVLGSAAASVTAGSASGNGGASAAASRKKEKKARRERERKVAAGAEDGEVVDDWAAVMDAEEERER